MEIWRKKTTPIGFKQVHNYSVHKMHITRLISQHWRLVCFVALLIFGMLPQIVAADCNPNGTWQGQWNSNDGASGPIDMTFDCDGHVVGTMVWDMRPDLNCVLYFDIDTTYTPGPAECHTSYCFEDTEYCLGIPVTINICGEGDSTGCDVASGTYSGTSAAGGNTFPESGTWVVNRTSTPFKAAYISPSNGAIDQPIDVNLSWSNCGGCNFDVYFGTDYNDVNQATKIQTLGVYKGNYSEREYQASGLSPCATYFWRIDNNNTNGITKGDVWNFITVEDYNSFGVINFEEFTLLASYWMNNNCSQCGWCKCMDFDRSGVVDITDLKKFAENWLFDFTLTGHWKMDDNAASTVVIDSSGNGNNGTARQNTSVLHTAGIVDGAFTFNGSSDYITVPKESALVSGTNDFTIAGWFNLNDVTSIKNLIAWFEPSSSVQFIITDGAGNIGLWAVSKWVMKVPCAFTPSTWYHIAWTRSGNTWKVYINGSQLGSDITDNCSLGTPVLNYHIGAEATAPSQFFGGKLDDVRVYNRALSASEVAELCPPETTPSGLIGHWPLDDNAASTVVIDSSGNGNNGTARQNTSVLHTAGIVDGAFTFNGSSDYITVPKESALVSGTNDFTIAGWFNLNDVTSIKNLIAWFEPSSSVQFIITDGAGNTGLWAASKWVMKIPCTFTPSTWYHIVWTRSGNTWKVYINGSQIGSDVTDNCSLGTPVLNYHIGAEATAPSQFFGGKLDDVRVYNRALSASEIAAMYVP